MMEMVRVVVMMVEVVEKDSDDERQKVGKEEK